MFSDIIIGRDAIEEAFGFPLHEYHWRELRDAGILFKKRFGSPPHRKIMVYTYRGLIYIFQREGGFQIKKEKN